MYMLISLNISAATNSSDEISVQCQNSTPVVSCNDTFTILNLTTTTQSPLSLTTVNDAESTTNLDITDSSVSSATFDATTTTPSFNTGVVMTETATVETITTEATTDSSARTTFSVVNSNGGNDSLTNTTDSAESTTVNHGTLTTNSTMLNIVSQPLTPGTNQTTTQSSAKDNVPRDNNNKQGIFHYEVFIPSVKEIDFNSEHAVCKPCCNWYPLTAFLFFMVVSNFYLKTSQIVKSITWQNHAITYPLIISWKLIRKTRRTRLPTKSW